MHKIPTLLQRDEQNRRYVTEDVTPGCEWVLAGEGVATRKYDGTCVMFNGKEWFARRQLAAGAVAPFGWVHLDTDLVTGKSVGWEPIKKSPFHKFFKDALENDPHAPPAWIVGTYELCGPRINGNPEKLGRNMLIPHSDAARVDAPRTIPELLTFVVNLRLEYGWEGLVFHHRDGRMAKLKAKDVRRD